MDGGHDDDRIFKALADSNRRRLLDELSASPGCTLTELAALFPGMTRFGVMKHLAVLEDAHLVVSRKVGRTKEHYLNAVPIRRIHDRWISKFTAPWVEAITALAADLEAQGEGALDATSETRL
jgi:DNA-binding transcriptional ArsR family regulator